MNTPLSSISYIDRQWNDVIFENRNKAYGAYYIRTHYNQNIGIAFSLTCLFILTLFVSAFLYFNISSAGIITALPPHIVDTLFITKPKIINVASPSAVAAKPIARNTHVVPKVQEDPVVIQPKDSMSILPVESPTSNTLPANPTAGSGGGTTNSPVEPQVGLIPTTVDTAMSFAEVMPEFPGGDAAMEKYIQRHTTIPNAWRNEGPEEGRVYFSFVVGRDGEIRDVKVISDGAGYGCGETNTGMFLNMPAWKPGTQNGHKVSVLMRLPIIFRRQ